MSGLSHPECGLSETNTQLVVPEMWDRVGCGLGGYPESKGGEIVEEWMPDQCLTVSACKQLWNWVGEQQNRLEKAKRQMVHRETLSTIKASFSAYSNIRLYMRKFFAGLIDFEENGENTDE